MIIKSCYGVDVLAYMKAVRSMTAGDVAGTSNSPHQPWSQRQSMCRFVVGILLLIRVCNGLLMSSILGVHNRTVLMPKKCQTKKWRKFVAAQKLKLFVEQCNPSIRFKVTGF